MLFCFNTCCDAFVLPYAILFSSKQFRLQVRILLLMYFTYYLLEMGFTGFKHVVPQDVVSPNEFNGLKDGQPRLGRPEKVTQLIALFRDNRFSHVGSPAGTGKTSLIKLCIDAVSNDHTICMYANMLSFHTTEECMISLGLSMSDKGWNADYQQLCNEGKQVVVFLDDAQSRYADSEFWQRLLKLDNTRWLPPNVNFVIFATYSLSTTESPISFDNLPQMRGSDMMLSRDERQKFLMQSADVVHQTNIALADVLRDGMVQETIMAMCGGHVGCLKMSVVALREEFAKPTQPVTAEQVERVYMSGATLQCIRSRCFPIEQLSEVPVGPALQNLLHRCLFQREVAVDIVTESIGERMLIRAGVLCKECKDGRCNLQFVNRAAERFANSLLFPNRLSTGVMASDLFELMKQVISTMSASALAGNAKASSTNFPCETIFQHALFAGMQQCTTADVTTYPELSEYIPNITVSGTTGAATLVGRTTDAGRSKIAGRLDFYLNSLLQWGVEVLTEGRGVSEHEFRMLTGGTYAPLVFGQSVVVDLRKGSYSKGVKVGDIRMTVYFPTDDFKHCTVVCGHNSPVTIVLQN